MCVFSFRSRASTRAHRVRNKEKPSNWDHVIARQMCTLCHRMSRENEHESHVYTEFASESVVDAKNTHTPRVISETINVVVITGVFVVVVAVAVSNIQMENCDAHAVQYRRRRLHPRGKSEEENNAECNNIDENDKYTRNSCFVLLSLHASHTTTRSQQHTLRFYVLVN